MQTNVFTIYLLKSGNSIYIGKTKGKRMSAVFSRHRCGKCAATIPYFSKPATAPELYILQRRKMQPFFAYKIVLAYIRLFMEAEYKILNAPRSIERSQNFKDDTQQLFDKIKINNIGDLLKKTKVIKLSDFDANVKEDIPAWVPEKADCQLTIRLTKKEKDHFTEIGHSLHLNQHHTLLYLFGKAEQTDPMFLDLEGDSYLGALLNS